MLIIKSTLSDVICAQGSIISWLNNVSGNIVIRFFTFNKAFSLGDWLRWGWVFLFLYLIKQHNILQAKFFVLPKYFRNWDQEPALWRSFLLGQMIRCIPEVGKTFWLGEEHFTNTATNGIHHSEIEHSRDQEMIAVRFNKGNSVGRFVSYISL